MGPDPGASGACLRLARSLPVDAVAAGVDPRLLTPTSREGTRKFPVMVQYEYLNHIPPPGGLSEPSGTSDLRLLQNQVNTLRKWMSTVFGPNWSDLLSNTYYYRHAIQGMGQAMEPGLPRKPGRTPGIESQIECPWSRFRKGGGEGRRRTRSRCLGAGLSRERPERRGGRNAHFRERRRGLEPIGNRHRGRRRPGAFVPKGQG